MNDEPSVEAIDLILPIKGKYRMGDVADTLDAHRIDAYAAHKVAEERERIIRLARKHSCNETDTVDVHELIEAIVLWAELARRHDCRCFMTDDTVAELDRWLR
jgi:hypothetical protein